MKSWWKRSLSSERGSVNNFVTITHACFLKFSAGTLLSFGHGNPTNPATQQLIGAH